MGNSLDEWDGIRSLVGKLCALVVSFGRACGDFVTWRNNINGGEHLASGKLVCQFVPGLNLANR